MNKTETVRLEVGALRSVLDMITEREAQDVISELYNEAEQVKVDPYDFQGEAFTDLLGGEVVSIYPAGDEEGIELGVYSPGDYLTFISGWADFCCAKRDNETFTITRINIMKQGHLTGRTSRALYAALRQIVRRRARAEIMRRRGEGVG